MTPLSFYMVIRQEIHQTGGGGARDSNDLDVSALILKD